LDYYVTKQKVVVSITDKVLGYPNDLILPVHSSPVFGSAFNRNEYQGSPRAGRGKAAAT
jgi:hypothetical protein